MNKDSQELQDGSFHWHLLHGMEKLFLCLQLLAVLGIMAWGTNVLQAFCGAIFSSLLILLSLSDYRYGLLFDELNLALAGVGIVSCCLLKASWEAAVSGTMLGAGILWLVRVLSKGGLGLGDVKLAGAMGVFLGGRLTLVMLLLAFCAGGLFAGCLLISGKAKRSTQVPFGPFLALGGYLALLFGNELWQFYEACL